VPLDPAYKAGLAGHLPVNPNLLTNLMREAKELMAIFISSLNTAKKR
jgi:hypothetical protein